MAGGPIGIYSSTLFYTKYHIKGTVILIMKDQGVRYKQDLLYNNISSLNMLDFGQSLVLI